MNILAAFFLIGLLITGLKILIRHLWTSLSQFNTTEAFFISEAETTHVNLLSFVSHGTSRHDSNYIRVTTTHGSNDRMRRLTHSPELPGITKNYEVSGNEIAKSLA